jgi:radical SAM superfamily enzyme YgiQ (UPF0313 family)
MKILMVYPYYPDTFWSFRHALKMASKKAAFPPLGLLTIAAMLPYEWEKKVVDMNVDKLKDEDIAWADYVFISAMVVQADSAREVIARAGKIGTATVAGGPLFTTGYEDFDGVDHFVLGEAEVTLPLFLKDIEKGIPKHIYTASEFPSLDKTPVPMWSLVNMKKYSSATLQYSRGCPYDCEFCDIVVLNGHTPRTKSQSQIIAELNAVYHQGWRGGLFVVDDNFIGHRPKLKKEILPAVAVWMRERKHPFAMSTEVSINLADDEELMRLMSAASFDRVFVGIETPHPASLAECNKKQNEGRDLVSSVKKLQQFGFEVQGGFIVGFDSDPLSIFRTQIDFIQRSGIVTAMVGLLNAPRGTKLYRRLASENRLLKGFTGDNTDCSLNFIPRMKYETLISGYQQVVSTIYAPHQYYARIKTFLAEYHPQIKRKPRPTVSYGLAFLRSLWILGVKEKGRRAFWNFIGSTLVKHPRHFLISVYLAIIGYHCRKVANSLHYSPLNIGNLKKTGGGQGNRDGDGLRFGSGETIH